VVALDLLEPPATSAARLRVRGDLRRLPIGDETADAAVYCASLHYAPVGQAVKEAARVLRPGGRLVILESAFYKDARAAAAAKERSRAYYQEAGAAELGETYHPIAQDTLESALAGAGFTLDVLHRAQAWRLPGRLPQFPLLVARRPGGVRSSAEQDQ